MLARLSCRERNRYYVCTVKQKKIRPTMTFNVFLSMYWNKRITLNVKKDTVGVNEVFIQTI